MDVRAGLWRKLSAEELMLLNCGVGEDSCESLGEQGGQTHPKGDQSWVFIGGTDVEAESPILWPPDAKSWLIWKDPDAGKDWWQEDKWMTEDERLDGITDSVDMGLGGLGSWWWIGRPGMLWFMGSQWVRDDSANEMNWTELMIIHIHIYYKHVYIHTYIIIYILFLSYCHIMLYIYIYRHTHKHTQILSILLIHHKLICVLFTKCSSFPFLNILTSFFWLLGKLLKIVSYSTDCIFHMFYFISLSHTFVTTLFLSFLLGFTI